MKVQDFRKVHGFVYVSISLGYRGTVRCIVGHFGLCGRNVSGPYAGATVGKWRFVLVVWEIICQ